MSKLYLLQTKNPLAKKKIKNTSNENQAHMVLSQLKKKHRICTVDFLKKNLGKK